jgi:hypothetical protein
VSFHYVSRNTKVFGLIAALFFVPVPLWAQQMPADHNMMNMQGMDDMNMPDMDKGYSQTSDQSTAHSTAHQMDMQNMDSSMDMSHFMFGVLGPYTMTRESSGTSWQPDSTPHEGMHFMADQWSLMAHGYVNGVFDSQGGPRGGDKGFSSSMAMLMAQRPVGDNGTLGLRSMISLDPLMGSNGYPLLFATGETADGHNQLVDRQHPHDLFMELAGTYSYKLTDKSSAFLYAGLPGEPALGPSAFMHRFSGMDNPEAPITHHWLDSTHITFGVLTAGYIYDKWKIEASTFRGREPDEHRFDIEAPKLDSFSTRLTYNPTTNWSFQTSWGYLKSPEELAPNVNENRLTASGTYNLPFDNNNWATTFAWGRKMDNPGHDLDGFLLESSVVLHDTHTFFGRAERVGEDELFEGDPTLGNQVITVNKLSLGYIRDFHVAEHLKFGVGGLVSRYAYPSKIDNAYGSDPTSYMLFVRLKLI